MKRLLAILAFAWAIAAPAFALDLDDTHWCRNGLFASQPEISLMRVTGSGRTYLRIDGGESEGCPGAESCKHGYLRAGQQVLAGRRMGDYVCVYYVPSDSAGWVRADELTPLPPAQTISPQAWLGHWQIDPADDSSIVIAAASNTFDVTGEGYWPARRANPNGPPQHFGDFHATGQPNARRLDLVDDACRVSLRLVGPYLVATDNEQCGGLNVRFEGVYARR